MKRSYFTAIAAAISFIVLILDAKTAFSGALEGVKLCTQALIPSLFPFFILSMVLTSTLTGQRIPFFAPIGRLCGMPRGSESLLLVGLLGGYPVGAQSISQAYARGQLTGKDAHRLLGFCSNAGPAFLFGMVAGQFSSMSASWVLWGIHILSALLTAILLPGKSAECVTMPLQKPMKVSQALEKSVRVMATVCGWVILFRIVVAFFARWFLWLLPSWAQTTLIGAMELANGCCSLAAIEPEGLRFVITAGLLSMGGLCVAMQTVTVTEGLGTGLYFPGKLVQTLISLAIAGLLQYGLFPEQPVNALPWSIFSAVLVAILAAAMNFPKKAVAFPGKVVYNRENDYTEVGKCSFGSGSKNPAPTASSARS